MSDGPLDTVLLVCGCSRTAEELLPKLYEAGFGVVGPVATARLALTLAAQAQPTLAVVASPPEGRRDAAALAQDLMETWGIPTWVLADVDGGAGPGEADWAAGRQRTQRLRHALHGVPAAA